MRTLAASPRRVSWRIGIGAVSPGQPLIVVLMVGASVYVAGFLIAAVFRLGYPFPLEVTEATGLRQVQAILEGRQVYVSPTLQYVPLVYGPVFFYAAALVAKVAGLSFLPMRLVSFVASVGTLALVGRLVHRETGSVLASLGAVGLLAATYPLAQTVLDLGRVDALFVFLLVASLYVGYTETLRGNPRFRYVFISGALLGLAGLTKLPMGVAPIALTLGAYLLVTARGRVIAFVVGLVAVLAMGLLLLRFQSGPWASWYLLDLPSMHAAQQNLLDRFWFSDLLPRFTVPLVIGPIYLIGEASRGNRRPLFFFGLTAVGLLGLAWASRSSSGGSTNVLLPAHVLVALFFGLGLVAILRYLRRSSAMRTYALGVCGVQLALLAYNPRQTVPYRSDQWADERLAQGLAQLPGEIFAPNLDAYLRTSDKGEQPLTGAVDELTGGYGGTATEEGLAWQNALHDALKQHRFSYVVLDEGSCCLVNTVLADGYVDAGPLFGPDDDFWRWKSKRTPEEHLYAPPRGSG